MTKADVDTAMRQRWLALLARTPLARLESALAAEGELPAFRTVRPAETGLVMVRGRAGGTGERFNLGEMTVSRCTVVDPAGRIGVGWVAGRDRRKAELIARADALLQDPARRARLSATLVEPAAVDIEAANHARATRAAATKVDFFTMVRGDD